MSKEYIERERLLLEVEDDKPLNWNNDEAENQADLDFDYFIATIKAQPTADVAEVKHGKWIKSNNQRTCSECGYFYFSNNVDTNYCSKCGAKMDEK